MSDSSKVAVRKGRQPAKGTAAINGKIVRRTGGQGEPTSEREKSKEVRADLQSTGGRQTSFGTTYQIEAHQTFRSHNTEWEELLKRAEVSGSIISGASGDIAFNATTHTISSPTAGKFNAIVPGFPFYIPPAAGVNVLNTGWMLPISKVGDEIVVAWRPLFTQTPAVDAVDIEIVPKIYNGTSTNTMWSTIEEDFGDELTVGRYVTHVDMKCGSGSITVAFPGLINVNFSFEGLDRTPQDTTVFTGTVTAADTKAIVDGAHNAGNIIYNDALAPFDFSNVTINVESGNRPTGKLGGGSKRTRVGTNTFNMSGSIEVYNDENCIQLELDHKNNADRDLAFVITDDAGNQMLVFAPWLNLASCSRPAGGSDTDIMCSCNLDINMHPVYGYMLGLFFRAAS